MSMFETLLQLDDAVIDWLMHASPKNDDDRLNMMRVLALRTELEASLNDLIAFRLKLAVANLPAETAQLATATAAMKSVAKTIESVQQVLTAAGTAVEVAAKALAFVATA
jgi:hypothetical protein